MRKTDPRHNERPGVALIVVMLVLAFMAAVGFALMTVTRSGPDVAGNVRWRQRVLSAAEGGVDNSLMQINQTPDVFSNQYRTTFGGSAGLDDPLSTSYFRKLTDQQLVEDVLNQPDHYIYASEPLPDDNRLTYTSFLIDPQAANPTSSQTQAILVCIGQGPQNTYVRIEILLEMQ
ncbi:MAG: hypothetical protein A2Y56_14680 [Candidatus Aminicenantes bacterium RBG_13_63_10]|nr:MAG: hypothetical protein A2Y56_14680 [Candidatus Aminicenantes bacterium RBG_13_63_10]